MPRNIPYLLIEYRRWFFAFYVLLVIALLPFIHGLSYSSDLTDYFKNNDARVFAFKEMQSDFGSFRNVIIFVEAVDTDFHDLSSLIVLEDLTGQIESLTGIVNVQSLTRHAITKSKNGELETLTLSELLNSSLIQKAEAFSVELGGSDNIINRLVSSDFTVAAIIAKLGSNEIDSNEIDSDREHDLFAEIESIVQRSRNDGGFRLYLWGSETVKQEITRSFQQDIMYLTPLILLVGLFILWITIRSFLLILAGLISIILAQCVTFSVAGAFSICVNQTSSMAFGLVFILTLANIIHLLASYLIGMREGHTPRVAMEQSVVKNIKPILLTTVTTMLGFLSLNFSDSPPFAVLGNVAAIGLFSAFCSVIMITPCLCLVFKPTVPQASIELIQKTLLSLCHISLSHSRWIVVVFLIITVIFTAGIFNNRFHNDPLDYFSSGSRIGLATEFAEEKFDTKHFLLISIDTDNEGGLFENGNMATINQFIHWLHLQPSITSIHSATEMFKTIQASLNDNNLKWYALPKRDEQLSDYYALYNMSLKQGAAGVEAINDNESKTLIAVSLKPLYNSELIALVETMEQWFDTNALHLNFTASGNSLMFAAIGLTLIENMMEGAVFTIVVITLVLMFSFGSIKIGFFSLLPNLIPAVIAFGVWGLVVGKLDIAAASTFSISLGIVVDDTIHFY